MHMHNSTRPIGSEVELLPYIPTLAPPPVGSPLPQADLGCPPWHMEHTWSKWHSATPQMPSFQTKQAPLLLRFAVSTPPVLHYHLSTLQCRFPHSSSWSPMVGAQDTFPRVVVRLQAMATISSHTPICQERCGLG